MGKIIITGPGRSGTSFLMQLLTRLGFDTGYEPYREPYYDFQRAGCEIPLTFNLGGKPEEAKAILDAAPRVLKSPEWALVMKGFVQYGVVEIDHCYIPLRDLDLAARSRLDVNLEWQVCPEDDYAYRLEDQKSVLAMALGFAWEACLVCDIPYTLMMFPRLVEDAGYCWDKLSEGLEIPRKEFDVVYSELARPEQVRWRP